MIVVFILSALWWRRIRGLWKLPDGRDRLRGKLDLFLIGGRSTCSGHMKYRFFSHLLQEFQNYNSVLNNHRQENVGSHQNKIPHIQRQRRGTRKTVGGVKSHLASNPISTRAPWRVQTNPVHIRTQRPHRD